MIVGLDVSTSITGVCLLDNDGMFVEASYIDLRKEKDFIQKCELFTGHFGVEWGRPGDHHYDY